MTTILLLIAAGIVLISLEVFLPGGILGIIGVILVFSGVGLAWQESGVAAAMLYLLGALILLFIVLVVEFKLLPRTRLGKAFFLQSASSGQTLTKETKEDLIGKAATALTTLAPSGAVDIDGKRYEAVSQDGYIARGEDLEVVSQSNFRLVVRKKNKHSADLDGVLR